MVGQRLKAYIQSCGLEAVDVPKVVVSFVAAKYTTWIGWVILGVRYQPLRCLVRARPRQQPSWLQQHQLRFLSAWNRAKQQYGGQLRPSVGGQRSASKAPSASKGALSPRRRWREAVRSSVIRNVAKAREASQDALDRAKSSSWYGWVSDKYWYLSDKLAASAQRSYIWSNVSSTLRVNPGNLALGFAEGTILYKLTFVFTAPIQLWFIIKIFQRQHAMRAMVEAPGRPVEEGTCAEAEAPGRLVEAEALESEEAEGQKDTFSRYLARVAPWIEKVLAATRDIEELTHAPS